MHSSLSSNSLGPLLWVALRATCWNCCSILEAIRCRVHSAALSADCAALRLVTKVVQFVDNNAWFVVFCKYDTKLADCNCKTELVDEFASSFVISARIWERYDWAIVVFEHMLAGERACECQPKSKNEKKLSAGPANVNPMITYS